MQIDTTEGGKIPEYNAAAGDENEDEGNLHPLWPSFFFAFLPLFSAASSFSYIPSPPSQFVFHM